MESIVWGFIYLSEAMGSVVLAIILYELYKGRK